MIKAPFATVRNAGVLAIGSFICARSLAAEPIAPAASPAKAKAATHEQEQQKKVDVIKRRIRAGDWSAMDDAAAQLDRSTGKQLLADFVMSQTKEDEPFRQAAGHALAKLGVEKDFAARIARASRDIARPSREYYAGIRERDRAFRALQYMRSNRAVAVLASFLSDETTPAQVDADVVEDPTCEYAAQALASLGFTDAPKPEHASISMEDVKKWKKWWIEHKSQFERE